MFCPRSCWVYDKTNHLRKDCYQCKGRTSMPNTLKQQANVVQPRSIDSILPSNGYYINYPDLNLAFNSNDRWFDSIANVHVRFNKELFFRIRYQVLNL